MRIAPVIALDAEEKRAASGRANANTTSLREARRAAMTTQRPRRGLFTSVPELASAIDACIAKHKTKAADSLEKVVRANRR